MDCVYHDERDYYCNALEFSNCSNWLVVPIWFWLWVCWLFGSAWKKGQFIEIANVDVVAVGSWLNLDWMEDFGDLIMNRERERTMGKSMFLSWDWGGCISGWPVNEEIMWKQDRLEWTWKSYETEEGVSNPQRNKVFYETKLKFSLYSGEFVLLFVASDEFSITQPNLRSHCNEFFNWIDVFTHWKLNRRVTRWR